MIVEVIGKANKFNIVFTRFNGDEWRAVVPSVADGRYFVEIYAKDHAGNVSFIAKAVLIVDISRLRIELVNIEYNTEFVDEDLKKQLFENEVKTQQNDEDFKIQIVKNELEAKQIDQEINADLLQTDFNVSLVTE